MVTENVADHDFRARVLGSPVPVLEHVTDRDFRERVLESPMPVLVTCRASWCVPSQQLAPIVGEIATEFNGRLRCVAVDTGRDTSRISKRYKLNRLPVTMLFDQGRVIEIIGGWTSKDAIAKIVMRCLSPVLELDEFTFEREVLGSQVPVLVHFDASWCQHSQALIPVVDDVAKKLGRRAKVARMPFGPETARVCTRFGVTGVPTLALFVDGQIEDRILGGLVGGTKVGDVRTSCVGLTSFDNIIQMVDAFVL